MEPIIPADPADPAPTPPTLPPVPDLFGKSWRQTRNPAHRYSAPVLGLLGGADLKANSAGPRELARIFAGPGAWPAWCGVWQWDEFNERIVAINPPFALDAESRCLSDGDIARVRLWLASNGVKASNDAVREALLVAATECRFHPVRDYLDRVDSDNLARWNGRPSDAVTDDARGYFMGDAYRAPIATRLFGSEGEEAARESAILMRQAIAAVRRIHHPGLKVDTMVTLVGEQGCGKSRFLAMLGGAFFTDQMPSDLSERHAAMHLRGKWIVEFPELSSFPRNSVETVKAFLSCSTDKYAKMHSSEEIEQPRQCVLFGSTNSDEFLLDTTGNRRFPVVHVRKCIDLDAFSRDEFWAAAAALEEAGEPHWTNNAADEESTRAHHMVTDPWDDAVERYLRECHAKGERFTTAPDVLSRALGIELARQDKGTAARVQGVLRRLCGPRKVVKVDGKARSAYAVPDFGEVLTRVEHVPPGLFAAPMTSPSLFAPVAPRATRAR